MKRLQEMIEAKPRPDVPRQLVIAFEAAAALDDAAAGTPKDRLKSGQPLDAGGGRRPTGGGRR